MKKLSVLLIGFFLIAFMIGCEPPADDQSASNGCGGTTPDNCTELKQYDFARAVGGPPTGPYKVVIEWDEDLPNHTIFRPVGAKKMPLYTWGEGGCVKMGRAYGEMLIETASHGILIIADGHPEGGGKAPGNMANPVGDALTQPIDYVLKKVKDKCSPLYNNVDTGNIGVGGQSCGGLLALRAAGDPRVTTAMIMSSGLFQRDQKVYDALHAPMIYINGGPTDVAYANAAEDIKVLDSMDTVPLYWANLGIGHMADILEDGGGQFGRVMTAWLKYRFWADPASKALFEGDNCGLCVDDDHASQQWTINKYNDAP